MLTVLLDDNQFIVEGDEAAFSELADLLEAGSGRSLRRAKSGRICS
jgi:hypothetical protein